MSWKGGGWVIHEFNVFFAVFACFAVKDYPCSSVANVFSAPVPLEVTEF